MKNSVEVFTEFSHATNWMWALENCICFSTCVREITLLNAPQYTYASDYSNIVFILELATCARKCVSSLSHTRKLISFVNILLKNKQFDKHTNKYICLVKVLEDAVIFVENVVFTENMQIFLEIRSSSFVRCAYSGHEHSSSALEYNPVTTLKCSAFVLAMKLKYFHLKI